MPTRRLITADEAARVFELSGEVSRSMNCEPSVVRFDCLASRSLGAVSIFITTKTVNDLGEIPVFYLEEP